jgi:hypothetical protein
MWRQSNWFKYGYMPVRIIAMTAGLIAGAFVWFFAYLMWLDPKYADRTVKDIF